MGFFVQKLLRIGGDGKHMIQIELGYALAIPMEARLRIGNSKAPGQLVVGMIGRKGTELVEKIDT